MTGHRVVRANQSVMAKAQAGWRVREETSKRSPKLCEPLAQMFDDESTAFGAAALDQHHDVFMAQAA